ncbi:MAG: hypothetical protein BAJALOKI3v1_1030017, partial [Promethearchaeota archaeon]
MLIIILIDFLSFLKIFLFPSLIYYHCDFVINLSFLSSSFHIILLLRRVDGRWETINTVFLLNCSESVS